MNYKSVFFLFSVLLSASASSANDDGLASRIYSFCQSSGGRVEYQPTATVDASGRTCVTSHCAIDSRSNGSSCDINIDSQTIPAGCARAVLKKCGTVVDDRGSSGSQSGAQSGSQSGAQSGSQSGAQSGSQSGAQSGSQSGAQSGSQSGAQSGSQSGAQSGSQSGAEGGGYAIICDELTEQLTLFPGDRCWNECKPRRSFLGILGPKKEGGERESCIKCLRGAYPNARWRDGNGRPGPGGVTIGGVRVGTGVIQCRRVGLDGAVFSHNGTVCPSGSVIVNGQVVSPGGNGNGGGVIISGGVAGSVAAGGNGGVVISGGVGGNGNANGNVNLPSICQSTRRQDIQACDQWIRNNARFNCSNGGSCNGVEAGVYSRYDRDCPNCGPGGRSQSTLSGIAEIAGAIAPPLAALGIGYFNSRAMIKSSEAWAGAAAAGFEQCQLAQNNYLQYLSGNELPGLTPEQQRQMNCNGYGLGQFAGMGGQFGGLYAGGYSPGFVGGMMGPYGGYNPYGMGGMAGGFAGGMYPGMAGGFAGGMAGGMYPAGGLAGGFVNGISLAGGVAAGMYQGGMIAGGMYPAGGMAAGGYLAGGMYPAGGMAGGMYPAGGMYNGGIGMAGGMYPAGGLAQGGYLAGGIGIAGGMGMAGGMYPAGGMYNGGMGMAGGMYPAGGLAQGGYLAGGIAGGMYPGGMGGGGMYPGGWGSGVGTGYGYPGAGGGYFGGAGGWGGNSGALSAQTSNYDAMLQQRGLAYNMGQMQAGGYGGYGAAGYSPMNLGGQLSGGLYLGGNFGGQFGGYGGF